MSPHEYDIAIRRASTLGKFRRYLSVPHDARLKSLELEDLLEEDAVPIVSVDEEAANDLDVNLGREQNGIFVETVEKEDSARNAEEDDSVPITVEQILKRLRPLLLTGKQFPDRVVKSYNWTIDEIAALILMEMSKHEELSID